MIKQDIENRHGDGSNPLAEAQRYGVVFQPRGTKGEGAGNQMKGIPGAKDHRHDSK